jgi:hypothetical protein
VLVPSQVSPPIMVVAQAPKPGSRTCRPTVAWAEIGEEATLTLEQIGLLCNHPEAFSQPEAQSVPSPRTAHNW